MNTHQDEYRYCPVPAIPEPMLNEIGRLAVHYGRLVSYVVDFMALLGPISDSFPTTTSNKEAIEMFPSAVEKFKWMFNAAEWKYFKKAIDASATAHENRNRYIYGCWGSGEGGHEFIYTEYCKTEAGNVSLERKKFTCDDIYKMAMDFSLSSMCIAKAHGIMYKKINEMGLPAIRKHFSK